MLEPEHNPNPAFLVDPPWPLRVLAGKFASRAVQSDRLASLRVAAEKKRQADGRDHEVLYFHQLDDPYSHMTAQIVSAFAARYSIRLQPHLIRATGGSAQPEQEKLAVWARRDCGLIAPHFGLQFPDTATVVPDPAVQESALLALAGLSTDEFLSRVETISTDLWAGKLSQQGPSSAQAAREELDAGSARLGELNHYSGATFFYEGEWYWGIDRLFHLEQRLRDLGACKDPEGPYLVERPMVDLKGVDASGLDLHFYPSLNSPYTSIIFDRTIAMAEACQINLHHKPVLPMIMRGVPAPTAKQRYILFDTKREADFFGVPFGPLVSPIGTPTRRAYSLLPWAKTQGKDVALLSKLLSYAWAQGKGLHKPANLRAAVEEVGLDWEQASPRLGTDDWKSRTEQYQKEMVEMMGLWGVPSYKLTGPHGEEDLEVWGQDRLWLVAAEIRRRTELRDRLEESPSP